MEEFLTRVSEDLIGRIHGPLTFRLLLQPAMAIFFATRAGLRDARENRPAYFWALIYDPGHRRDMLRDGWHDIGKVLVIAAILDIVYQLVVIRWIYPGETLVVATVLAMLPYLLTRGPVTRIARFSQRAARRPQPPKPTGTQP